MKLHANALEFEVEDSAQGDPQALVRPAVVLVMGLGMQLVAWPQAFVSGLVEAGFRVVCFDNRDVGLSSHLDHLGRPGLLWFGLRARLGLVTRPPYTLCDMAADTVGLMDALGLARAHIVGVSMGGMVAQRVALAAPQRVQSLTSIMSSSGARGLPGPQPSVLRLLLSRPGRAGRGGAAALAHFVRLFQAIGSPAFPTPPDELRARIQRAVARSYYPDGTLRQMLAIVNDTTRASLLAKITCPTLLVHGTADPLVPLACGEDTARRIPGARFLPVEGMGHDLPAVPVARILAALVPHLQAA